MATPRPKPKPPLRDLGFFSQTVQDVRFSLKLFWRLFRDQRINGWLKAAWVVASFWFLMPFLPDLMPGLPFDDLAAPVVFAYIFNALAPAWIVTEVKAQLEREERGELPQKPVDKTEKKVNPEKKPASAEPKEKVEKPVKPTGRYAVQNGRDRRFVAKAEISGYQQEVWEIWEEYEILDPKSKKTQTKWRRYR